MTRRRHGRPGGSCSRDPKKFGKTLTTPYERVFSYWPKTWKFSRIARVAWEGQLSCKRMQILRRGCREKQATSLSQERLPRAHKPAGYHSGPRMPIELFC